MEMRSSLRLAPDAKGPKKHVQLILRFAGQHVDKTRRLERMEREIRQMQEAESSDREELRRLSTTHAEPPVDTARDEGEELPSTESLMSSLLHAEILCNNQVLEDIEISPLVFCDLFIIFYRRYHPRFPLLPDLMEFTRNCTSCPLLFWAVVAIASGCSETHRDLHLQLGGPVRRLGGIEITRTEASSLSLIHALLILCCWPQPYGALATDPSWLYCGSATHIALKIGLHRPGNLAGFIYGAPISEEQMLMRRKTWVACFIMNQNLSCQLGIPSTVKMDHTILNSLGPWSASLPTSMRDLLQVSYKCFSFSGILGHYEGTADGLLPDPMPIIESFGADLNALETAKWESWNLTTKLSFLWTKLHLYAYSFTAKHSEHQALSSTLLPDRRSILYFSEAYATAIRLIQTWCDALPSTKATATLAGEPSFPELARCWTIFENLALTYAVMSLLKLAKLTPKNNFHEVKTENAIRQAATFLRSCSVFKDDHFSRLCDILEYICRIDNNSNNDSLSDLASTSKLEVRSRMSSNIMFDAVLRAKERFQSSHAYAYGRSSLPPQERGSERENGPQLSPSCLTSPFSLGLLPDNSLWNALELDFIGLLESDTIV